MNQDINEVTATMQAKAFSGYDLPALLRKAATFISKHSETVFPWNIVAQAKNEDDSFWVVTVIYDELEP